MQWSAFFLCCSSFGSEMTQICAGLNPSPTKLTMSSTESFLHMFCGNMIRFLKHLLDVCFAVVVLWCGSFSFPLTSSPCVCALIVRSAFRRVKASVFTPHKQLMGIFSLLLLFHPATLKFISHGLFTVRLQHAHLLPCWDMTEGSG